MAQIIHEMKVEVAKPNLFQAIIGKQNDYNSRFLKVTLVDGLDVINVTDNSTVTINARRPDGASKRFVGEVNADGTVTVPLAAWMLELDGMVDCDISVIDADESKLTTTAFKVKVDTGACSDADIAQDENYDVLTRIVADCGAAAVAANEALTIANEAASKVTECEAATGAANEAAAAANKAAANASNLNAANTAYDNTQSGLTATTVQAAIDEIVARIGDIETALDGIIAIQESLIGGASE